ncbi:hypothetical protein [Streptomyces sp. NBC_00620]|uniref:hypothetical protein n=1 Tax=Streptomyces sp. NBC_00620 TaxID=2903666 RepID=UPI002251D3FB|nr:hypothetical protein [Streptomyces sp. NBC_00620]MCX4978524.1 hypothetical protein [Streptomyces sp. NBC_00620]
MRGNTPADWIISTAPAHLALASQADFITVQHLRADPPTAPGRTYLLAGLLRYGACKRRMESCRARRPAYRCRHGHSSATPSTSRRKPNATCVRTASCPTCPHYSSIEHLRTESISLTFNPRPRTLTADTPHGERITTG